MRKFIVAIVVLICITGSMSWASTAGKIVGTVTDADTGQPLAGVNVFLEGTTMGAATDENGFYVILNVPPGEYTIRSSMIGYAPVTVQEIQVSMGLTTTIDFQMTTEALRTGEVIVVAERPLLKKDEFTSRHSVSSEDITMQPIENFRDIARNQAGVVGNNFRGGRSGEVLVLVDGIPVRDPAGQYSGDLGGFTANIPEQSIQELEVTLGGFSAEYGNVQSGVLNLAMKEGGSKLKGLFKVTTTSLGTAVNEALMGERDTWLGTYDVHTRYDTLAGGGVDTVHVDSLLYGTKYQHKLEQLYQFSLSGPIPFTEKIFNGPATFFVSADVTDRNQSYMINQNSYSDNFQGKLTFKPSKNTKLAFGGLYSSSEWDQFYLPASKYGPEDDYPVQKYQYTEANDSMLVIYHYVENPDEYGNEQGIITPVSLDTVNGTVYNKIQEYYVGGMQDYLWNYAKKSHNVYLVWTHTLSSKTYYELRFQNFFSQYHYATPDVDDRDGDGDTEEDLEWDVSKEGPHPIYREREDNYWWIRGDDPGYRHQESVSQTLKGDLVSQVTRNHLIKTGFELNLHESDVENISWTLGPSFPRKDIWNENTIDLGIYAQDKMEFEGLIALIGLRYDYFNPNGWGDPIYYPSNFEEPFSTLDSLGTPVLNDPISPDPHHQLSPRLGISHPITDRTVLHFTYGHYFQRPDAYFLYRNHTYTGLTKAGNWVGNPNLKPEKTVAYDIGLEHLFTPDLKASVTGYVKDVTNLVDNYKFILRKLQGTEVRIFQNADYANIKGLEFALQKRLNDGWGFTANYTFSVAKGRSTSYTEGAGEYDSAKRMNILGYDQTHTVNATLTLASSEKFNPLLRNWRANLLFKYGSGLPYTSYNSSVPNDARMPWTANFDLRINRTFNMGFADLQIFMDIFNLMNRQNVDWIGDARYYELYDDPSIIRYNELSGEMTRSPQVYSNERQFRFGMSVQF